MCHHRSTTIQNRKEQDIMTRSRRRARSLRVDALDRPPTRTFSTFFKTSHSFLRSPILFFHTNHPDILLLVIHYTHDPTTSRCLFSDISSRMVNDDLLHSIHVTLVCSLLVYFHRNQLFVSFLFFRTKEDSICYGVAVELTRYFVI